MLGGTETIVNINNSTMKISEILLENVNQPFFYHAMPKKYLSNVLQYGLDPKHTKSSLNAIFLAGHPSTAENYTVMHSDTPADSVILKINSTGLDLNLLGPDNYELQDYLESLDDDDDMYGMNWNDLSWKESLQLVDQVAYYGTIDPKLISVMNK